MRHGTDVRVEAVRCFEAGYAEKAVGRSRVAGGAKAGSGATSGLRCARKAQGLVRAFRPFRICCGLAVWGIAWTAADLYNGKDTRMGQLQALWCSNEAGEQARRRNDDERERGSSGGAR